jgi:hypothetical protein
MAGNTYKFEQFTDLYSKEDPNLFILKTENEDPELSDYILKQPVNAKLEDYYEGSPQNEKLEIMDHLLFINILNQTDQFDEKEIEDIQNRKNNIDNKIQKVNRFKRKSQEEGFLEYNIYENNNKHDIDLLPGFSKKKLRYSKSQGKTTSMNEPLEVLAERRKQQVNSNLKMGSFDQDEIDPFSSDHFERVAYCDEFDSEMANKSHKNSTNQLVINSIDDSSIFNIYEGISYILL